jgi:hypothetical protein
MKQIFSAVVRYLTLGTHFLILLFFIGKTYLKRAYLKMRRIEASHPHLQLFIDKRNQSNCNLNALLESLHEKSDKKVLIATLVKKQETYTSKDELLSSLPRSEPETETIAIPLAVTAFSFFRHFVTIIVDHREGIIEFYDPIGFSVSQYKNAYLWGPLCKKGSHLNLSELIEHVKNKYNISTVIENKKIHQTDFNQCALFVYDRVYKRGCLGYSIAKADHFPMSSKQGFI